MFTQQYGARDIGVCARGMYSDGRTEVDAYTSADRSLSVGWLAKGARWGRSHDLAGVGYNVDWISREHALYLGMGGVDGFVGDGAIQAAGEGSLDMFYNFYLRKPLWLSGDFQHIVNPGFNADRGPVNVFSVKIHGEF
jgi:hypothetical protein